MTDAKMWLDHAKEQIRSEQVLDNLLRDTLAALQSNGKTPNDVEWVGNHTIWFTWDEFAAIADVQYDAGFGIEEVASDLVVVGTDWWLERGEYDGSEWWSFNTKPTKPHTHRVPTTLTRRQAPSYYGWHASITPEEDE